MVKVRLEMLLVRTSKISTIIPSNKLLEDKQDKTQRSEIKTREWAVASANLMKITQSNRAAVADLQTVLFFEESSKFSRKSFLIYSS